MSFKYSNTGRKATDEHRRNLSIAHLGNTSALGHKLTQESKLKIAKSKAKYKPETVAKIKTMINDGFSETDIIKELGVSRWAVYSVKYNKRLGI